MEEVKNEAVETKEDLVTRVSQVKAEVKPQIDEAFNVNDIDKIEDPNAKEYAQKAYKSFEKGYQEKFRNLSEERKAFEAKQNEINNWTPDKVQSLLNDPKFSAAAQGALQNIQGTTDEYSALSDAEKRQNEERDRKTNLVLQQNAQLLRAQQDEQLKSKYANYDSNAVDIITSDMLSGKLNATREHMWKVHDYDAAVHRGYQLGLQDRKLETQDKVNSMSTEGTIAVGDDKAPKIEDGESNKNYFLRLAARNVQRFAKGGQNK